MPLKWSLCRAVGCEACGDTGYKGRTGVHELLVGTHELQSMIYKKADLSDLTGASHQGWYADVEAGWYLTKSSRATLITSNS